LLITDAHLSREEGFFVAYKDTIQRLQAGLDRHPSISYEFGRRRRHEALYIRFDGRERYITFSTTPTDRRAVLNAVSAVRRIVGELGAS
jgi:hypothetical protein